LRKSLKTLAPIALCAFAGNALADDTSVTLYGILDEAVANIAHALDFSPDHPVANNPTVTKGTQSATGILNGGMSATRWGIKGQEDLGDGMKAVFLLEQGFNMGSGAVSNAAEGLANNTSAGGPYMSADSAISGQFFNRGAYVGLGGPNWGTVTFGRQQSFFLDNISIFDAIMGSQAFSPLGFSGTYGGGGATDDSRVDNSIKYRLPIGDFTVGALYKFGGVAGANSAQSAYEINVVYASEPLAVQLGWQKFDDAFSLSNNTGTGSLKATAENTNAYMAAVKYTIVQTTLRAGFERETYSNPSNPTQDAAVTSIFGYPVAAMSVTAYDNEKALNVFWLGVQQDFSHAITALLGGYHVSQNGYDCPTNTASGCSGSLNYYSLVGDYHFSKRTDSYLGLMISTVSGGPANAVVNKAPLSSETSNRIIALGIRHVF
jgi:predicted porin